MIKVKSVYKRYTVGGGNISALINVSLHIPKGEVCSIVGPSGSGKSTLLSLMAGLDRPSNGEIDVCGKTISSMTEEQLALFRQKNTGFVFQSYNLLPYLTAVENVALPLMFHGVPKNIRLMLAAKELQQIGLGNRIYHKPSEMSGGQQQRVGIARAFIAKPDIVFADEPTGNLDSATSLKVLELMIGHCKNKNITLIMVTHEKELAEVANRIIKMKDGRIENEILRSKEETYANREFLFSGKDIKPV